MRSADTITVTLSIRMRWWLHLYLATLVVFCRATGMEPDQDKLSAIIKRGLVLGMHPADRDGI